MTEEEAVVRILEIAYEHDLLAIVVRDQNPDLKIVCGSPYKGPVQISGQCEGLPVAAGSDQLCNRVLTLKVELNDISVFNQFLPH
jgi:hypothetical protein